MQKYKLINNITGWVVFVFAAVVYTLTMEKSGSFWDCGEFVSGCYKLQVVHPPGAPFFLMLGRIFTLFSGGNPLVDGTGGKVAASVNFLSALATAGAVMFTFWTVTALVRKVIITDGQYTTPRIIAIMGAGLLAATCATFLDSSWFSAVEGEVYALSQFFMSAIVWLIMKWDADDSPYADSWLLLIAYLTGLSIGVHLLSLLAIPAISLVYYYKRSKNPTTLGWFLAIGAGFLILGLYMKFIISYTQSYLAGMDLFFVNLLGLGFNSGIVFGVLLLIALIVSVIWYTHTGTERDFYIAVGIAGLYALIGLVIEDSGMAKLIRLLIVGALFLVRRYGVDARRTLNLGMLALAFSYIGYLSYIMVPIRAIANPPINMNRPNDPFTIKSYVDREQYGDRPLLFGPAYTATFDDIDRTKPYDTIGWRWVKDEATRRYINTGPKIDYNFKSSAKMFFPRLGFWQEEAKKSAYRAWLNPSYYVWDRETNTPVQTFSPSQLAEAEAYVQKLNKDNPGYDGRGKYIVKDKITFADNLAFFFKYQVGFMYFRYFFWNFAGRQNDIQGTYANDDGRWISGIPFIDKSGLFYTPEWPQENLPKWELANKARNKFYLIPFIIGMAGFLYTLYRHEKIFWIILVLFGTAGLLQIVYQNEPPIEPRERDYAQAGSFIVFCMWIGFGFIALYQFLKNKIGELPGTGVALALCAAAPLLMGMQGWDDHNRHGRHTARDFARCYLESCAPNAVIFTQGDNDTYPLWYAQEVEGIRTDVRVINLSLLGVDWYIDQLRYKINDAPPLKLTFRPDQYAGDRRNVCRYRPVQGIAPGTPVELSKMMKIMASDDPRFTDRETEESYYFTKTFYIDVDTAKAAQMNFVSPDERSQLVPRMEWTISNNALVKNDLMTLDIIANNFMERPIYFAVSVAPDAYLGLEKYFQLEGLAYRIVPKVNAGGSPYSAPPRTDVMYENMMKKFRFGNIAENPHIYLDENNLRMVVNVKGNFGRLAEGLIAKGEKQKAAEVIDYSLKVMPPDKVPHSVFDYQYPEIYYKAGQPEKARKLLTEMWNDCKDYLNYYQTVYRWTLNNATRSGDMEYVERLKQGGFTERREVREKLYIMQELVQTVLENEEPELYAKLGMNIGPWLYPQVQSKAELDSILATSNDPSATLAIKLRNELLRYKFGFVSFM
ncbi:MAG: DUF2723 domain-containing protein [Chitinophagales bacterium]|nr:DUF2723 domain-containing protein [Chitinophagales bacterium]MDW8418036.1 DUF2723 domain-containing protein [Chitinophagales bacterium]